jgi:hypothetical protein
MLPVTEFAILRLKDSSLTDPELIQNLRRVSTEQSAWSSFPLHWFTYDGPAAHETYVCILSQWASVPAHQAWIDSAQNQALLALLAPKLDIASFCHIDLRAAELGRVFEAESVSWRSFGEEVKLGDASGWVVDTPKPTFYVFQINSQDDTGFTTMSRLELSNV